MVFLSSLLPYELEFTKKDRLEINLNEYLLLLTISQESIESFLKGEFGKFDPLVGENSCQIRAAKIAMIAANDSFEIEDLLRQILFVKKNVSRLLECVFDLIHQEHSLYTLFNHYDLDIRMHPDAAFLVKSYILSVVKEVAGKNEIIKFCSNEKTVSKRIKTFGNVSGGFADSFIRGLREKLAKSSAQFVKEIAKCPILAEEKMEQIIEEFSISYNGLDCTPFYWMTKLIMHKANILKIPIVMFAKQLAQDENHEVLEETTLFFYPEESGYRIVPKDALTGDQPVIIFNVVSCKNKADFLDKEEWEKELTEYDLTDLVLACNAAHRQYPDPEKEHLIQLFQDEKYEYHLQRAREWGCFLENPSRFFLTHIYCENLKNI